MKYAIKQLIIERPEIELPVDSKVVSVKHHDAYTVPGGAAGDLDIPECWQIIWLESIL